MTEEEILDSLDSKILESEIPRKSWRLIIDFLFDELEEFLGERIHRDPCPDIQERLPFPSFCCDIMSVDASQEPLATSWRGLMGMQVYEDNDGENKIDVSVSIFLFHGELRLKTAAGQSHVECVFKRDTMKAASWQLTGWAEDEWREFDDIESPSLARKHG